MKRAQIGALLILAVGFGFALHAAAGGGPTAPEGKARAKKTEKPAAVEKKAAEEAAKPAEAKLEKPSAFRYGFDERIRQEYFDDIPVRTDPPGVARGGENNYYRFRTRVWAEADGSPDVTFRARLVNEFRLWDHPDMSDQPDRSSWDFPDEWVVDHLYLDIRNLFDRKLDLRIGRQDLIYGTGMLILEGTPKDGSRTIYFNAAKAVWKGFKNTTVDVFGIYNPPLDELAINSVDRDLTGQTGNNDDITESGAGVYVSHQSAAQLPLEAYVIYKRESSWDRISGTTTTEVDPLDLGTLGLRLMPKFAERLSGNLETAYQYGERGDQQVSAYGINAFLTHTCLLLEKIGHQREFGIYYLSGDNPDTGDDEGWNPLWARYPHFSELYAFAWDADGAARWSNLAAPYVCLTANPWKWLSLKGRVNYLWAPEDDGSGGGQERGWLYQAYAEATLVKDIVRGRKDRLTSHVLVDLLDPGDYYSNDDWAVFARWEVVYTF